MLESVEIKKALHYNQNILNNQLDIKISPIIDILTFNLLTLGHPIVWFTAPFVFNYRN